VVSEGIKGVKAKREAAVTLSYKKDANGGRGVGFGEGEDKFADAVAGGGVSLKLGDRQEGFAKRDEGIGFLGALAARGREGGITVEGELINACFEDARKVASAVVALGGVDVGVLGGGLEAGGPSVGIKEAAGENGWSHRADLDIAAFWDFDAVGVEVKAFECGGLFDARFEDFAGGGFIAQKMKFGLLERALFGLDLDAVIARCEVGIESTVFAFAAVVVGSKEAAPTVKKATYGVVFARSFDAKLTFLFDAQGKEQAFLFGDLDDFAFLNFSISGLCWSAR